MTLGMKLGFQRLKADRRVLKKTIFHDKKQRCQGGIKFIGNCSAVLQHRSSTYIAQFKL
jgi:hypothetical protein